MVAVAMTTEGPGFGVAAVQLVDAAEADGGGETGGRGRQCCRLTFGRTEESSNVCCSGESAVFAERGS